MTVAVFPFRPFTSRLIMIIPSSGQPDGDVLGVAGFFFLHRQSAAGFPKLRQILPVSVEYTRRLLILEALSANPILNFQTGYALKLSFVVGHDGESYRFSVRGDPQIVVTNRCPFGFQ